MGCANTSLVGCNGYERWRMHWKHPDAPDYITARDSINSSHLVSDISRADGNRTFRLRDFVTYGDAVRIRLPYTDSSACSNQYIWLENHKVGQNGKLDFLQYSNEGSSCRPAGAGGIYAYYQIGRDLLTGSYNEVWFSDERDNLRQIPAEGFHDYTLVMDAEPYYLNCINYTPHKYHHVQGAENPFNGYSDLESQFNPDAGDDTLKYEHEHFLWRKVVGNNTLDGLSFIGDNSDAFSCHSHINMGTNPSTCNAKLYYNYLYEGSSSDYVSNRDNPRNVRHTWLSGLGITMEPLQDGDFLVRVRWDDYDITNDAIWTGQVMLSEEARLTRGHSITLTQNRTPEQPFRDSVSGEFAPVSRLCCKPGSRFRLEPQSSLFLDSKSRVLLDSGSRFEMGDSTEVHVGAGCFFEVSKGADLKLGRHAYIVVDGGGTLVLRNRSRFNRNAHIRVLPGGRLIAEGATLTGDGDGMWGGIVVYGDPDMPRTATCQGSVRIENCEISHAECALSMGINMYITATRDNVTPECGFYGGGIVRATGTLFRDNRTAVVFTPYERLQSVYEMEVLSKSCFRECTFTLDDSIRFSGSGFNQHVWLDGVRDPLFLGCHFTDMRTDIPSDGYGCGIKANRSGVVVDCYEPIPGQAVESRFSNFRTAVRLQNGTERFTAIRHTRFENNLVGIHALATHHTVCRSNTFQISNPIPNTLGNAYGLLLEQSWAADVRDNDFTGSNMPGTAGALVYASGPEAGCVRNNTFHYLCAGVLVSGSNADLGSDTASCGLTACCNEFRNNGSDIHIRDAATMAVAQGAEGHATGNTFLQSSANIQKLNMQRMLYYYNSNGAHHFPASIYGNGGNLEVNPTTADDCGEAYGAVSGDLFTGSYSALSLQEMEQAFAELRQSYTESQQNYEGRFPGNGVTSGAGIGTLQRNAFVSLQQQRHQMEDICREAIMRVCADSLFDRQQYVRWLTDSRSVRSAYALLEDAYRNDPDAFAQLALTIPEQYAALDANEFNSLLQLYGVRNPADSVGCGWANLDGNAVTVLQDVAAMDDYAGAVAKSVLDNSYGVAYTYNDQHPAWPVGLNCLWRRDSTTTDSTDIDTTGYKLLMTFTDQDTLPQRTSYMSFFGKNRTEYAINVVYAGYVLKGKPISFGPSLTRNIEFNGTEKVYNGKTYKLDSNLGLHIGLREDTVLGRLYRYYPELDTEVLLCDMSLHQGDTFRLPWLKVMHLPNWRDYYYHEWNYPLVVDTVFYEGGFKHINFKYIKNIRSVIYKEDGGVCKKYGLPLAFIEGIGPSYGIGYVNSGHYYLSIMLCLHKDDTLSYMLHEPTGCNHAEGGAVNEPKRTTLTLQPNPAQDYILLRNEDASDLGGEIIITDAVGRVLRHCTMENAEMRINTGSYSIGTYFLRYRSKNGVQTLKFVKVL